jgi:YHS domain-containing protein
MAGTQGSQGSHSQGSQSQGSRSQGSQMTDPVCGMKVDEKKAGATSSYQGQTYHFCSQECKQKFDKSPQQFAKKTA